MLSSLGYAHIKDRVQRYFTGWRAYREYIEVGVEIQHDWDVPVSGRLVWSKLYGRDGLSWKRNDEPMSVPESEWGAFVPSPSREALLAQV